MTTERGQDEGSTLQGIQLLYKERERVRDLLVVSFVTSYDESMGDEEDEDKVLEEDNGSG